MATTTKLDRLLQQLRSYHSEEEWTTLEKTITKSEDLHASPKDVLCLCLEDASFADELYQKILKKEDNLSWSSKSTLKKEDWQTMVIKYASYDSLVDKFNAVLAKINDIHCSAVMMFLLRGYQSGAISLGKADALEITDCLIKWRTVLHDRAITLQSVLILGGGKVPTLCQLPRDPGFVEIRNVLITSILEVFSLPLLQSSVHQPITDAQFDELCKNEILIVALYRVGTCMADVYMKARPREPQERRRAVEQMMWTQLMSFTGWSLQQIQTVDQKYGSTELEKLIRQARQLVEGPNVARYIFTKLKETTSSKDLTHTLDFLWRSRMVLCNW